MQGEVFQYLAGVCVVAGAWIGLFQLNLWLFSGFEVSEFVNWIFLPATVRLLSVMVFGWAGVAGLFLGNVVISGAVWQQGWVVPLVNACLSAFGPALAVGLCRRAFNLSSNLRGLEPAQLITFALVGAIVNSITHSVFFAWHHESPSHFTETWLPMFVGDFIGTLLPLYGAAVVMRFFAHRSCRSPGS